MNFIGKLLRGDNIRPTRLHTESGQYCGHLALPGMFPASISWLRSKLTGQYLVRPWWVFKAIHEIGRSLQPTDRVLEVGSGYGTLWLAERCQYVCSIEEDASWVRTVSTEAHRRRLANLEILNDDSFPMFVRQLTSSNWDVVIIDGPRDRLPIFKYLLSSSRRPRIVVYDDTDTLEGQIALRETARDYVRETYRGFKPQTVHACETTVFRYSPTSFSMRWE
jgi:hypothetical protein